MIVDTLLNFTYLLEDIKTKGLLGGLSNAIPGMISNFTTLGSAIGMAAKALASFLFTTPVGWATIITAGVVTAASVYKKKAEEIRKATDEAATAYKESSESINDYVERYHELQQALKDAKGNEEETYNVKKQLLELQNKLNDSYGDEYNKINLVTDAYKDQTNAINQLNKKKAIQFLDENKKGIEDATYAMENKEDYSLGYVEMYDENDVYSRELKNLAKKYSDRGIDISENFSGFEIVLTANATEAESVISDFVEELSDLDVKYSKLFDNEEENPFKNALDVALNSLSDAEGIINQFGNSYKESKLAEITKNDDMSAQKFEAEKAIEAYNEAVLKAEDPLTDEDVAVARQKIAEIKQAMSEGDWLNYSTIVNELFAGVDTVLYDFNKEFQNNTYLQSLADSLSGMYDFEVEDMINNESGNAWELLERSGLEAKQLIDYLIQIGKLKTQIFEQGTEKPLTFIEVQSNIQNLSKGLDQLDSIYADILNKEDFDYSSILNNDDFKNTFGNLDGYDEFIKTIANSNGDINACQAAFDNLSTAYIRNSEALKGVTEESKNAAIAQLEQMGIANAEEMVMAELGLAIEDYDQVKKQAANSGVDLINATIEEINMLALEGVVSGQTAEALFYYQMQKYLSNENSISTVEDCNQLITLAENCGVTGGVLKDLIRLREIYNMLADSSYGLSSSDIRDLQIEASKLEESIKNQSFEFKSSYKPLAKYAGGLKSAEAANKAAKSASDAFTDSLQKQIDALNLEKDALEKQKEHYEQVIEAINWFYDKQIEKVQDLIDALEEENELLSEQQSNYDMALSAIDRFYQNQIELIQEEQEAIDKCIEALQKENDERKKQYELEQKQLALERARNQKTALTYTADQGYVYMADQTAIKDAENDLADTELDNVISKLEEEKEALQANIDKYEEYREQWNEISDTWQQALEDEQMYLTLGAEWEAILLEGRIGAVTSFKDNYVAVQKQINDNEQLIKSHEEKIEYYESLKEEWENLTKKYEEETYIQLLIGEFGNDYENELLNGRTQRWEQFADDYVQVQRDLKEVTDQIEELERRMQEYKSGLQNAASGIDSAANTMVGAANKMTSAANEAVNAVNNMNAALAKWGGGVVGVDPWILESMPHGYATGGIIDEDDAGNLDHFARAIGEDHMVAVQNEEAIIPVNTVKSNPELVNALLDADGKSISLSDKGVSYKVAGNSFNRNGNTFTPVNVPNLFGSAISGFNLDKVAPKYENKMNPESYMNTVSNENSVSITIGDIHLSGVQDVNGLSNAIINKLPNTLIQALGRI